MSGRGKTKKQRTGGRTSGATPPGVLRTVNRKEAATKIASLPKQYTFTPSKEIATGSTQSRLPSRERPTAPAVKDYPPPLQLFQTPNNVPRGSQTATTDPSTSGDLLSPLQRRQPALPNQEASPPLQTQSQSRQSLPQARALRQTISHSPEASSGHLPSQPNIRESRQSTHSSQAQNDLSEDEETDDEAEAYIAPIEPTLSEDVLAAVNALLVLPNREDYCHVLSPRMEPGTIW